MGKKSSRSNSIKKKSSAHKDSLPIAPTPEKKAIVENSIPDGKVFHKFVSQRLDRRYILYRPLRLMFLEPQYRELIKTWNECPPSENHLIDGAEKIFQLPADRFGGIELYMSGERVLHPVLRHNNHKDHRNSPLIEFLPLLNENMYDEYEKELLNHKREKDNLKKSDIEKVLKEMDTSRSDIHSDDLKEAQKIVAEKYNRKVAKKIKNFMETCHIDTWILIYYWGFRLKEFIKQALDNIIGYFIDKRDNKNCSFIIVCEVSSTSDENMKGYLNVQVSKGKKMDGTACWEISTCYINKSGMKKYDNPIEVVGTTDDAVEKKAD